MDNRIYVIGYYGYGNIGDEAMKLGLQKIMDFKGYGNVRFYEKGKSIIKDYLWANNIVLGGGTHIRDWGKHCVKQSVRIIFLGCITKLFGKKFYMLNVGIDGKKYESIMQNICDNLTIRDRCSFDSSVVLDYENLPRKNILGISLTPYYELFEGNEHKDKLLIWQLMFKVNQWLIDHPNYSLKLFNFNKEDERCNYYASSLLEKCIYSPFRNDVKGILKEISECSAFIGMRYHSNVFAYITNTPQLVINTYPSCRNFAEFTGLKFINKERIIAGQFKLEFSNAKLSLSTAKSLAFNGVKL